MLVFRTLNDELTRARQSLAETVVQKANADVAVSKLKNEIKVFPFQLFNLHVNYTFINFMIRVFAGAAFRQKEDNRHFDGMYAFKEFVCKNRYLVFRKMFSQSF